jgi:GT2 family glycosyltransferase
VGAWTPTQKRENWYPPHNHAIKKKTMSEDQHCGPSQQSGENLGVVVIGRNEGERLRRCLVSLRGRASLLVYVDSGSTDGSVALAKEMGAQVIELDTSIPFTAARARNTGLLKLRELGPGLAWVQFVDGDCEVMPGWLESAVARIADEPTLAVVCGRLRERHPDASIYNRLCDMEWNTPVGYADASGGNAMMRIQAVLDVGGFNPALIAGEEPDLCLRLRQRGFRILRMADEMMLHDACMTRFGQWTRRTLRSGHAYAEGYTRHRKEPGRYYGKQVRSDLAWGVLLPLLALAPAWPTSGLSLLLLAGYPVLAWRVARYMRRRGFPARDARLYAFFCVLGKFPSAYGQLRYGWRRLLGRRSTLIEYRRIGTKVRRDERRTI